MPRASAWLFLQSNHILALSTKFRVKAREHYKPAQSVFLFSSPIILKPQLQMRTSLCLSQSFLVVMEKYKPLLASRKTCSEPSVSQGKAVSHASAPPTTQRMNYTSISGMDTSSPAYLRSMVLDSKCTCGEREPSSSEADSSATHTAHCLFSNRGLLNFLILLLLLFLSFSEISLSQQQDHL